jgi:hypothetical protein
MRPRAAAAPVVALACILGMAGCTSSDDAAPENTASAGPDELRPELGEFTRLAVTGAIEVTIESGSEAALVVNASADVQPDVEIGVQDGTLTLDAVGIEQFGEVSATLTVPDNVLDTVEVSSSAIVTSQDTIVADGLEILVGSAGSATLNASVDALTLSVDGSSTAELTGEADTSTVSANAASFVIMQSFAAGDATVTAEGASSVEIAVTGALVANATGGSTIRYSGAPTSVEQNADALSSIEAG